MHPTPLLGALMLEQRTLGALLSEKMQTGLRSPATGGDLGPPPGVVSTPILSPGWAN